MIDLKEHIIMLRQAGIIKGNRPIFIDIQKGEYPYRKKYILTIEEENLHFYQLKKNLMYKGEKARDFLINYQELTGYRIETYKENRKRFILYFSEDYEFIFTFPCNSDETYDNEANVIFLMKHLKDKGIYQKNKIKGSKYGKQKAISKSDQWFTQEVRSPKKRGLFK